MQPDPAEVEKQRQKQELRRKEIQRMQKRQHEEEIRRKMQEDETESMGARHHQMDEHD